MSYSLIGRTYMAGLLVAGAGVCVGYACVGTSTASPMWAVCLVVAWTSAVACIGGLAASLYAFIGALKNLAPLEDQSWLRVVLVLGVYTLTIAGMVVYLVFRPDAASSPRRPRFDHY